MNGGQDTKHYRLAILLGILILGIAILFSVKKQFSEAGPETSVYPAEPEITAHAYLVKFLGDAEPVLKRREWKALPPASLIKILTAIVALENLSAEDAILISEKAQSVGEKVSGARAGERFRRDDLLRLALVHSANDAAMALAEAVGEKFGAKNFKESAAIFTALLKDKARSIGMLSSSLRNPTGLDTPGQVVSAEDLARLIEYAWYNHPKIWEISRNIELDIKSLDGETYLAQNTNDLLKIYPAILGSKTGSSDEAGENLVMLYPVKNDKIVLIIVLKSENRFRDGENLIKWVENNLK